MESILHPPFRGYPLAFEYLNIDVTLTVSTYGQNPAPLLGLSQRQIGRDMFRIAA
jgi:hypothetical protein